MKNIIVIGAGILGASTAYHLAKSGAKVTIIDRKDAGQATSAAAGIICPWVSQRRNKAWYALAKNGAAYYPAFIEELEENGQTETGYKQVGAVSLHTDEEKLRKMEERAHVRKEEAPEIGRIERMTMNETKGLFPPLSSEYFSLFISGAARVNGRAVQHALIQGAKKYGAEIIVESASLVKTDNDIHVRVGNQILSADSYIITAGAWAKELLYPLGINLHIRGQKAQIVHLKLDYAHTENWPVVMPPNNQYILAFGDGKIVLGATYEDDQEFDLRVTAGGVHEILDKGLTVAPGLANAEFVEAKVGYRPVAPNFLPIIGRVPRFKNLFLANGLGSSGLTVGPYLGYQLAKLVLEKPLDIDLNLYKVEDAIEWL